MKKINKNGNTYTGIETQNNNTNTYIIPVDDGDEWSVFVNEYYNNNEKLYELYLRNSNHKYNDMYIETVSEEELGTENFALLNHLKSIIDYKIVDYKHMLSQINRGEYI